jgi:hypothetical protein|tara:strand:- start:430 stop:567 length:138 start_codon:yes stop_codon:yes gene_type:complete
VVFLLQRVFLVDVVLQNQMVVEVLPKQEKVVGLFQMVLQVEQEQM